MSRVQYLAELVAYDLVGATTTTLRYCTGRGFVTTPSETPANTEYAPRLTQPLSVSRYAFAPGATSGRSVVGFGDLILSNGDGALDALSSDYAFDGRTLTIRKGTEGAAYPAGFPVVFVGTMEQVEVQRDSVLVRCKDRAFDLEAALQGTLYAGDNALPAGLEGTADDLKGKPKPLAYGVVKNATLPCVNTSKLIYQLHDGTVQSVDGVYDAGIELGAGLFMALGTGRWRASSPDGLAWGAVTYATLSSTAITASLATDDYFIVARGETIEWTADGTNWSSTSALSGLFGTAVRGLAFDGTTYVAVGDGGNCYTATSLSGAWTSRTSSFAGTVIRAVVFAGSQFVAVGVLGKVATSPTGTTWTAQTSGTAATFYDLDHDGTTYVAVGASAACYSSTDAVTWTSRTSGVTASADILQIATTDGLWLLGTVGGQVCLSTNGTAWTNQTTSFPYTYDLDTIGCGNGTFLVGGVDGKVARTTDGVAWEAVILAVPNTALDDVKALLYRVAVTVQTYASDADLADDALAPLPGTYAVRLASTGSYVRLGSSPYGTITADLTVGATAADRTAAQCWADVLTGAGYTSADWVAADLTTLDTADNSEVGYFTGTEPVRIADVLDALANTVGAWWGPRASDGDFRLVQLLAPSGTAALTITAHDLVQPLRMLPPTDAGRGLPSYLTTLRYAPNWTVQTDGLADGVTAARRAFLVSAFRETSDTDATVQTAYLLALATTEETLYTVESDATAEAVRRQALRGVRRRRFDVVVELNDDTDALDLGDVVALEHTRFDLTPAVKFRILGVEPNARDGTVRLHLWGN